MEQYWLQQKLFQEGSDEDEDDQLGEDDDDESWEPEDHVTTAKEIAPPEKEESADVGEFRIMKDNQLWENQEDIREGNKDKDNGEEIQMDGTVDGTLEKGLGPTDTLVQTGNPHQFQPYMMKILKTDEQKADWQDKDPTIALVKTWLKEDRKSTSTELNYRNPNLQAYRKILAALKLRPVKGTGKTILV